MSEQQPKRHNWRGPIILFALGIPLVGAIVVTVVTIIFLQNAGDLHLTWASTGAIGLSLLVSFVLLFIVFVLGIIFTLRVFVGIVGTLLNDLFPTAPKPRQTTGGHPIDEFLLNMTHSMIMPHLAQGQAAGQEAAVEAAPQPPSASTGNA
jgi:hypothetical protein